MCDFNSTKSIDEYVRGADLFIVEATRRNLIKGILISDHSRNNLSPVKTNANTNLARNNFKKICDELSTVEKSHEYMIANKENDDTSLEPEVNEQKGIPKEVAIKADVQTEILRAQAVLEMLQNEKSRCDALLVEEKDRLLRVQKEVEKDALRSDSIVRDYNPDAVDVSISSNPRLKQLKSSRDELKALYAGLCNLVGVQNLDVSESGERGGVYITFDTDDCVIRLTLSAAKVLSNIEILKGEAKVNIKTVLEEVRALPSPQDLRYAVFALTKTQTASEVMQLHLSELRRRCIVTVLGPLSFRLELKGGVIADAVVHECYPEVPFVKITSLTSTLAVAGTVDSKAESATGTKATIASSLEAIRYATNEKCFSSIPDMYQYLTGPKALGGLQMYNLAYSTTV